MKFLTRNKVSDQKEVNNTHSLIWLLSLILLLFFACKYLLSAQLQIPAGIFAFLAGVAFENKRITKNWYTILAALSCTLAVEWLIFNKFDSSSNNYQSLIILFPYLFSLILIVIILAIHKDKIIPKLTEGLVLLQSIAFIYWAINKHLLSTPHGLTRKILIAGFILSIFASYHALSNSKISRTGKLFLSIWSSFIIMIFSIENMLRMAMYPDPQPSGLMGEMNEALHFFLLGISIVYLIQNFFMLWDFLPGWRSLFGNNYFKRVSILKNKHVERYEEIQVKFSHSSFCIIFCSGIFALNYYFHFAPAHILIWLMFLFFPYILTAFDYLTNRHT